MKKSSLLKNVVSLSPILIILAIAILSRASTYSENLIADEIMFYKHAKNITKGYYADAANPNILEGPGYPLFISISAALDIPYVWTRSFNIIFLFVSYCFLFLILQRYIKRKPALILTYLFALYPPVLRWANLMYAESIMLFLLLGFCYNFILWYHKDERRKKHFLFALLFLGFLALTKIIWAYVIITALVCILILLLFKRIANQYRLKGIALILIGAMAVFSPYIISNYYLTGKFFYLGTHGGVTLYARSTPFDNEYGNWFSELHVLKDGIPTGRNNVMANMDQLKNNHREIFKSIDTLSWIEKDSVLTLKAIENMKNHPAKYLKNTGANVSRLFFHFPFSYRMQNLDTLGYLIPNMFIVVLALIGIYPAYIRRHILPKELLILMGLICIYLGGHLLLDSRGRYFIPAVPIWLLFFSFVYFKILKISIAKETTRLEN